MQQKQEQNRFFKLLLLGDRAVGKTTLLQKFFEELDLETPNETSLRME
ncbi:MAG: hypothetical protein LEGION0403_FIIPPAGN_01540 [Legionella sp.]